MSETKWGVRNIRATTEWSLLSALSTGSGSAVIRVGTPNTRNGLEAFVNRLKLVIGHCCEMTASG